jgi:hypothetical protein
MFVPESTKSMHNVDAKTNQAEHTQSTNYNIENIIHVYILVISLYQSNLSTAPLLCSASDTRSSLIE